MKILVVGPSWVGDMVMSQSLYKMLKAMHPNAQLDVLAPDWCRPLLERMPEVDNALRMPLGHGDFGLKQRWKIGRSLANQNYDWAIVQPNSMKSALIPWFARIPRRSGWKGESRYGLLNDLHQKKQRFALMVERYVVLALGKDAAEDASDIPAYDYPRLVADQHNQQQAMTQLGLDRQRPILALNPGAEFGPAKRWPESHYATVANDWIQRRGGQVWLFGSAKDQEVTQAIKQAIQQPEFCFDLAGKTQLAEAIDLMAAASASVSNDSGLMHVAAALGLPLVAVYGSSSPKYTPPLSEHAIHLNTDIECRPCFQRVCPLGHNQCLTQLEPSRAIDALEQLVVR
ncbi:lipopolysaccharide heptosyltransferase II [Alginatibacterium sediminis]|uniref:lipopolysaccharide heptosyltransferase II n=1 Tax=Alginatibacterium sediminis TaxID=2164068 RepID=A0A420EN57_9ALTE|nr:lipopolysaccharide heptosyltransferase II [Alginatibacterium sediminis]RKF22149.1 lipopolysaccharide heptosyltransferase II [Alginatibacterium sediminis]